MLRGSSNAGLETDEPGCAARIRAAIKEGHESMLRSIAVLVAKSARDLRWPEVMEMAADLLHEAVEEALEHAKSFDPARSPTAWVRGIAAKLLLSRRRAQSRASRCIPAAVLGEEAWAAALQEHCTGSTDAVVARRLDLEQALTRISALERQTLEFRYYQGLDGEELAAALGVTTRGAARVRVCRALHALRAQFAPEEHEVLP
jgi:RNA polymerase sigma factor (sigma-70 family)